MSRADTKPSPERRIEVNSNCERRRSMRREVEQQLIEGEGDDVASSPEVHYGRRSERPAPELLSFHHPARTQPVHRYTRRRTTFRKERYVQANFKFLVSESEFVNMSLVDPDYELPWEGIEEVFAWSTEPFQCPLCLFPPMATKMSKCGHVFCWTCFLRYFYHNANPRYKRCPLCFEPVRLSELKSVTCVKGTKWENDGDLLLIRRDDNGLSPVDSDVGHDIWWDRVKLADPEHISALLDHEAADLDEVESAAGGFDDDLLQFVQIARKELAERRKQWIDRPVTATTHTTTSKAYYFYQSVDGSPMYLLPLCSRVMLEDYQSFENMPKRLNGHILEIDQHCMTVEARKRLRHLSHLPLGSEFSLVELDMRQIASGKARNALASELRQRQKQRNAKKRAEQQNQKRAEAAECASEPPLELYRLSPSPPPSPPSPHQDVWGGSKSFVDALRTPMKIKGIGSDVGLDVPIDGTITTTEDISVPLSSQIPWGPSGMKRSESVPSVTDLGTPVRRQKGRKKKALLFAVGLQRTGK